MNKQTAVLIILSAIGIFSLIGFIAPSPSEANHYARQAKYENARRDAARRERRNDWTETRKDRAELRRDQAELERDRADLRQLYRRRASRAEIERKKAEIRNDLKEIGQDRREVRDDYGDLCGGRYDNWGRWQRDDASWWNWGNGWWNSGRDRRYRYE